jgi:hypothetical protein
MSYIRACLLLGILWVASAWAASVQAAPVQAAPVQAAPVQAAPNARLALPDFSALEQKSSQTVNITLDPSMLAMASRFLDSDIRLDPLAADQEPQDPRQCRYLHHDRGRQGDRHGSRRE